MDADGYFYLVDRLKEVIVTGGYKVYPRRVEEAIHRHPAVAEVTVVGIPDDYRGEVPKAFVRLKDGESLTLETLRAFLADKISPMELPRPVGRQEEGRVGKGCVSTARPRGSPDP